MVKRDQPIYNYNLKNSGFGLHFFFFFFRQSEGDYARMSKTIKYLIYWKYATCIWILLQFYKTCYNITYVRYMKHILKQNAQP